MMKFLIDKSPVTMQEKIESQLVVGQLITPLTGYRNWGGVYAIDNGAFSSFKREKFLRILARESGAIESCLFVTCPDIVGSGRRTLEIFSRRASIFSGWPVALVVQNGVEDLDIPWDEMDAMFVGGVDPWKESKSCADLVKTAKTLGKHVHIGRVNCFKRWNYFNKLGADTCDGSGVAMYDHMLANIERQHSAEPEPVLFNKDE